METSVDNQRIIELESEISEFVRKDNNCTVHFDYSETNTNSIKLDTFTYNPKKKETFLLKSVSDVNKIECLKKIMRFLELMKNNMASYTVEWRKIGGGETEVSYFYAHNPLEVLQTFYVGKEIEEYIVSLVKMNPMA